MTNKLFLATATAVVATASLASVGVEAAPKQTFLDIDKENEFYSAVEFLATKGLVRSGGNFPYFEPNKNITRTQIGLMIGRSISGDLEIKKAKEILSVFTDSNKLPNDEDDIVALAKVVDAGIFVGVDDNGVKTFGFDKDITRGQMANVMSRYISYLESDDIQFVVLDNPVKITNYGTNVLEQVSNIDILAGYGLTTVQDFRASEPLKRSHMAKFLHAAMTLDIKALPIEPIPTDPSQPALPKYETIESTTTKNSFIIKALNDSLSVDDVYLTVENNKGFEGKILKKQLDSHQVEVTFSEIDYDLAIPTEIRVGEDLIGDFNIVDVVEPTVESFDKDSNGIKITFSEPIDTVVEDITVFSRDGETFYYKVNSISEDGTVIYLENSEDKEQSMQESFLYKAEIIDKTGNKIESDANGYTKLPILNTTF